MDLQAEVDDVTFSPCLAWRYLVFLSMKYLEYCPEYNFYLIHVLFISELTSSKKVKVSENDIKALVSIFLKPNLFSVAPPDAESKCTGALQVFQSFSIKIQNINQIWDYRNTDWFVFSTFSNLLLVSLVLMVGTSYLWICIIAIESIRKRFHVLKIENGDDEDEDNIHVGR